MKNEKCFKMLADHEKKLQLFRYIYIDITDPFSLPDYAYVYLGAEAAEYLYSKKHDYLIELIGIGLYTHDLNIAIKNNDLKHVDYLFTEYEPGLAMCSLSLETAVKFNRYDAINLFVKRGYDFNHYYRLVEKSIVYDNLEMYKYLIKLNPAYDRKYDLYYCAENNAVSILEELLESSPDVNFFNAKNSSSDVDENANLLFAAVSRGSYEAAEILLNNGADVNYINLKGETALLKAVKDENLKMVELLLKYKADVNIKFYEGIAEMSYYNFYFGLGHDDNGKIFTVMDFNQSYSIYLKLRSAGVKYAWE